MSKDQTPSGKGNKSNAQHAADKNEDSTIKDLKERKTDDISKIKGGTAKKTI